MHLSPRIFSLIYGLLWTLALPFLFISRRLRKGWRQRMGWDIPQKTYDIWMQAASGGEAYLAVEIIKGMQDAQRSILVTTNTEQGAPTCTIADAHPNRTSDCAPWIIPSSSTGSWPA